MWGLFYLGVGSYARLWSVSGQKGLLANLVLLGGSYLFIDKVRRQDFLDKMFVGRTSVATVANVYQWRRGKRFEIHNNVVLAI